MAPHEGNHFTVFYPSCFRHYILFEGRTMDKDKRGGPLGHVSF